MTGTTDESVLLAATDEDDADDMQDEHDDELAAITGNGRRKYATTQRKAREGALQVLYEVDLVGHAPDDVQDRQFEQMGLLDEPREFAARLVAGVWEEREMLDAAIAALAPAWPVRQLPRVDINILRLALYELMADDTAPVGAIINEAVELAKRYGSENSGKFVNGVLGTVAARLESGTLARGMGAASLAPATNAGDVTA